MQLWDDRAAILRMTLGAASFTMIVAGFRPPCRRCDGVQMRRIRGGLADRIGLAGRIGGGRGKGRIAAALLAAPVLAPDVLAPAVLASALLPSPARADVKAGVDAWSNGDYPAAVREWQGPAAKGDPDAQFNMAQAYKLGRGVPLDLAKAEALYLSAANAGHARAADNYGILLFQTNRQTAALPWLNASAERGEPRAMYVLGIAAYNGDFVPRDWVRAYALMTRAAASGLQQAVTSLGAMNEAIPIEQRQQGAALALELERSAEAARSRQLAASDLGAAPRAILPQAPAPAPAPSPAPAPAPAPASAPAPAPAPAPSRAVPRALPTVDLPPAQTGTGPIQRADDAPAAAADAAPAPAPAPAPVPAPVRVAPARPAAAAAVATGNGGSWKIQFGAFGVKANADALWARLRTRSEVAGHPRVDLGSGVTRLLAGGYSEAGAERACASLKAAGFVCLVVRP